MMFQVSRRRRLSGNEYFIMIHLHDGLLVGKGNLRSCYRHPSNPEYCIKVFHTWNKKAQVRCQRELKYLNRYKSSSVDLQLIPNYYGTAETNVGVGYIFERIKNWDGSDSENVSDYLADNSHHNEVGLLITEMYKTFLKKKVLVSDLHPGNILVQKKDSKSDISLKLVDGFGNSDFIKICDYSDFFMKKKLMRKFIRLKKELSLTYDEII